MKFLRVIVFIIAFAVVSPILSASQLSWDPTASGGTSLGGTGSWDTNSARWFNGTADIAWTNANNDDAIFTNAGGTVTLSQGINAGTLYFTNLSSAVTIAVGTQTLTLTNGVDTGTTTNTISAVLAGSSLLRKNGNGTLVLGTNNTGFTGGVTVNQGAVQVTTNNALGSGTVTVTNAGSVEYNWTGTNEIKNALVVSGSGVNGEGALFKVGGSFVIVSNTGAITLPSTNAVFGASGTALGTSAYFYVQGGVAAASGVNANLVFRGGTIFRVCYNDTTSKGKTFNLNAGSVTVVSPAQVSEQATTSLVYSNLVLNGGQFSDGSSTVDSGLGTAPSAFNASSITMSNTANLLFSGTTVTLNGNRGIFLGSGGGQIGLNSASATMTVPGAISGTGSLLFESDGSSSVFKLTGNNTYSGGTTIQSGDTLNIGNGGGSGTLGTGNTAVNVGGTLIIQRTGALSYAGAISGGGTVTIQGGNAAGTITLSGNSSYTAATADSATNLLSNGTNSTGAGPGRLTVGSSGTGCTLGGTGMISCPVTIAASGNTIEPGSPLGTVGTLSISNSLILSSGSISLLVINSATPTYSSLIVLSNITYAGALSVTNIGGSNTLAAGQTYQLITTGTHSGSFSSVQLPPIPPGLGWNTNNLYSSGAISVMKVDRPPFITNRLVTNNVTAGSTWKIAIANLSAQAGWGDPDVGDTVTLSGVDLTSANGTNVTYDSQFIYYNGMVTVEDHFGYTITDGTLTTNGTVYLEAISTPAAFPIGNPGMDGNGHPTFSGQGIPNYTYGVESATSLSGPWSEAGSATVGALGSWSFTDSNQTNPAIIFYRLYYPDNPSNPPQGN